MFQVRVGAWCVLGCVLGCATGTEPNLDQAAVEVSGGTAGAGATGAGGSAAGNEANSGTSGSEAGGSAAGNVGSQAGAAGTSGSAGNGAAGSAGSGGSAGSAGSGGSSAGAGGMPPTAKPTSLSLNAAKTATDRQVASPGGTNYDDSCPQGQVLIGFDGTVGADETYLRSMSGVCGTLAMQAQSPYAITLSKAGNLPMRMTAQATKQSALCPANQVVVGFSGRSGGYIDALSFDCAPLSVGAGPDFNLVVGNTSKSGILGGATGGSAFAAKSCAAGQVAVAQQPMAGNAIDSFGLACSVLDVVVE